VKSEFIELPILAQRALGAFTQISLRWPKTHPAPLPGELLRLHDGSLLYPMLHTHSGQLEALSSCVQAESSLKLAGSTGERINLVPSQPALILADGIALATLIHLCSTRRQTPASTLALYQLTEPLPFRPQPSRFLLDGMPDGVIAAIPLLEDWGIPSRLCHSQDQAGCFEGSLDELVSLLPHPPECQIICLTNGQ
jgi:dihydroorotate dehydrogenase electron transfer subunit